jgi:hypothetical protein
MEVLQRLVPAITGIVGAIIGAFVAWRVAKQNAVLELFDRRSKIYETVKNCVDQVVINPLRFDNEREKEFLRAVNEAYFLFGDDLRDYLETLRKDIVTVRDIDRQPAPGASWSIEAALISNRREQAMNRINKFSEDGQPLFAKYMRFSQAVPSTFGGWRRSWR